MRIAAAAALIVCVALTDVAQAAGPIDGLVGSSWGESPEALQRQLGARGIALPRPIDFGDSYAPLVLRDFPVAGFPLIVFYQIDKASHRLKRIQLELPRHKVSPVAFRAIYDALVAAYGPPDSSCGVSPGPAGGYQGGAEHVWVRSGVVIRAIFRDTTLEALGGCFSPACGLTAQLLLRLSPPGQDGAICPSLPTADRLRSLP